MKNQHFYVIIEPVIRKGDVKMKEDVRVLEAEITAFYKIKRILYLIIKRIFDIIVSSIGLIFLLPIALMIKLAYVVTGDHECILFTQDRIGKGGKNFKFFKFRSMVPNADKILYELMAKDEKLKEEYSKNKKLKNDPRITKIGKIIRKTSIDELPQLIKSDYRFSISIA